MRKMMYVERCTGTRHNGPAWIAEVSFSKSMRSVYFNGMLLKKAKCCMGNYYDLQTGDTYWVSGVKQRGTHRHIHGRGKIQVERRILEKLLHHTQTPKLNTTYFTLIDNLADTSEEKFVAIENAKRAQEDEHTL